MPRHLIAGPAFLTKGLIQMNVSEICDLLHEWQRERSVIIKSRIMLSNRLTAIVAGQNGYKSKMDESERVKLFDEARKLVKRVAAGEENHKSKSIIDIHYLGIKAFLDKESHLEKPMRTAAGELPVAAWASQQRGFGLLSLAIVVGEAGNLSNYSTVGKLWKRFGCAPYSYDGETKMGATWRGGREGKLPAEEWEAFGYSPRRRSIAYVIGENLVKLNKGEYRQRYETAKADAAVRHPDWIKMRCHRHGMLLATKRLLRNLWCEWNSKPIRESLDDNGCTFAASA